MAARPATGTGVRSPDELRGAGHRSQALHLLLAKLDRRRVFFGLAPRQAARAQRGDGSYARAAAEARRLVATGLFVGSLCASRACPADRPRAYRMQLATGSAGGARTLV